MEMHSAILPKICRGFLWRAQFPADREDAMSVAIGVRNVETALSESRIFFQKEEAVRIRKLTTLTLQSFLLSAEGKIL